MTTHHGVVNDHAATTLQETGAALVARMTVPDLLATLDALGLDPAEVKVSGWVRIGTEIIVEVQRCRAFVGVPDRPGVRCQLRIDHEGDHHHFQTAWSNLSTRRGT